MDLDRHIATWKRRLTITLSRLEGQGAEVEPLFIAGDPGRQLLTNVETKLGRPLPAVLKNIFIRQGALRGAWRLPTGIAERLPTKTREVEWGGIDLSVGEVVAAEEARRSWVRECFADPTDDYDRVWHGKFGLLTVPNGDCIAVCDDSDVCPVYYLSHDDGEGHGVLLAPSLLAFLDQLSLVAFAGPEDWLLLPFVVPPGGLDASTPTANEWRLALDLHELVDE